jgi:prepilin-type N-terminal cleavage/methylation domain-containing protein
MGDRRRSQGMTLIELMVAVGVIGAIAAIGVWNMEDSFTNQRAKAGARSLADAFVRARAEAMRTGNHYVVVFGPPGTTDGNGTAIADGGGNPVPVMILDDGPPATSNCRIDNGESRELVYPVDGVSWGVTHASSPAPGDTGTAAYAGGVSFADPGNNLMNWVLFRPDGVPVAFTTNAGTCDTIYNTGTGGGALYITNTLRDYSVVLTRLGGVKVRSWNGNAWSS